MVDATVLLQPIGSIKCAHHALQIQFHLMIEAHVCVEVVLPITIPIEKLALNAISKIMRS
jgi:hypothetical protein